MRNQQRTPLPVCNADQQRITLLRQTLENFTVVASALVAESSGRRARLKTGCPTGRAGSSPAERTNKISGVHASVTESWKTCRIQAPVPRTGRAGSNPAGRTTLRVVGEIAYHS